MRSKLLLGLFAAFCIHACLDQTLVSEDILDTQLLETIDNVSPTSSYQHYILPEYDDYASIPNQDPENPLTAAKIELGKMLFFETGLAQKPVNQEMRSTYSCGSCHIPSAGFTPGRFQGIADGGIGYGYSGEMRRKSAIYDEFQIDAQGIRALSMFNTAFVTNTLWNGQFGGGDLNKGTESQWAKDTFTIINHEGYKALESQNLVNFKLHRMRMDSEIIHELGYNELFDKAFPELSETERYSEKGGSFAVSAYLRSLITSNAPFQKYLKGQKDALTEQEKRGAMLFFDKANCVSCHNGPAFNANQFIAIGVNDLHEIQSALATSAEDKKNFGRGSFTGESRDYYKFKVPQLYNLRDAHFYFHGSSKNTLKEVVEYFNDAIPENSNVPKEHISPEFKPLNLTKQEIDDLVMFLKNGLFDPTYTKFVPNEVLSGNCFPNNDSFSRKDIGCQ